MWILCLWISWSYALPFSLRTIFSTIEIFTHMSALPLSNVHSLPFVNQSSPSHSFPLHLYHTLPFIPSPIPQFTPLHTPRLHCSAALPPTAGFRSCSGCRPRLNDSEEGAMDKAYWLGLRAHYAIAHHDSVHEVRNKRGNGAPTRSPTPLWLGMSRSIDTQTWPSRHWLHLIRPRKLDHAVICHLHRLLVRNLLWSYSYEVVSLIWHPKHWLR